MAINTSELVEAVRDLEKDTARGASGRLEFHEKVRDLENKWKAWLFNDADPDLSEAAGDLIFKKAWEDGRPEGYESIESHFRELLEFVKSVVEHIEE